MSDYPNPGSAVTPAQFAQPQVEPGQPPVPAPRTNEGHADIDVQSPAREATTATREAARDVAHTAKQDLRSVAQEVGHQAQRVALVARDKARDQVESQQREWAEQLRSVSRDLQEMSAGRPDTPARTLVNQLADRGVVVADYLSQSRPEDILDEARAFARRRPATFVVAATVAGFVVGRLGKGAQQAYKDGS